MQRGGIKGKRVWNECTYGDLFGVTAEHGKGNLRILADNTPCHCKSFHKKGCAKRNCKYYNNYEHNNMEGSAYGGVEPNAYDCACACSQSSPFNCTDGYADHNDEEASDDDHIDEEASDDDHNAAEASDDDDNSYYSANAYSQSGPFYGDGSYDDHKGEETSDDDLSAEEASDDDHNDEEASDDDDDNSYYTANACSQSSPFYCDGSYGNNYYGENYGEDCAEDCSEDSGEDSGEECANDCFDDSDCKLNGNLEGEQDSYYPYMKNKKCAAFDKKCEHSAKCSEKEKPCKCLSEELAYDSKDSFALPELTEEDVEEKINKLGNYVNVNDMFLIWNYMQDQERKKYHNMRSMLMSYCDSIASTCNIPEDVKRRECIKTHKYMTRIFSSYEKKFAKNFYSFLKEGSTERWRFLNFLNTYKAEFNKFRVIMYNYWKENIKRSMEEYNVHS
ncbi:Plasmodium exported protein (PHIST), unknown function [Plasmodium ovale curtisi]|uniref:Plasmodium RESA N-terminal domain-containing protein n=1 Tax=Plasmodium ovale curtisi TaxID=864141 RepID=A0A1A8VPV2_PLAOA|nr:Plasmodium exported protein (PHIST), unknown function [Plasmodium ovale curtisi]